MGKVICFYHGADFDGKCSAAIVAMAHDWNVELVAFNHTDDFPWDNIHPEDTVFLVDIALPTVKDLVTLNERCDLIWIDHHVKIIEKYDSYIENAHGLPIQGLRRVGEAACELCWKYFFGSTPMSKATYLLGRFDVWKHFDIPDAIPFQYGLKLVKGNGPKNKLLWSSLLLGKDKSMVQEIIDDGRNIYEYERNQYASLCNIMAFETELGGLKCIALNKQPASSLLFESIWDEEKYDAMIAFGRNNKGHWTVSMYTDKEGVDVGNICVNQGGGGHKQAAGFSCEVLPFKY